MCSFFLNPSFELIVLNVKFLLIKKLALKHVRKDSIQHENIS